VDARLLVAMEEVMRRVVLLHTAGPYPGLRQICGAWDSPLPAYLGPFEVMGRTVVDAVLEKVTERVAFYKETK
jgi:hypothetical protein